MRDEKEGRSKQARSCTCIPMVERCTKCRMIIVVHVIENHTEQQQGSIPLGIVPVIESGCLVCIYMYTVSHTHVHVICPLRERRRTRRHCIHVHV